MLKIMYLLAFLLKKCIVYINICYDFVYVLILSQVI
jgi:hypothetical protein